MRILLATLLSFLITPISAQDSLKSKWLKSIDDYRTAVLSQSKDSKEFAKLEARWRAIEPNDTISSFVLFNSAIASKVYNLPWYTVKKQVSKHIPNSDLCKKVKRSDLVLLENNFELVTCIMNGYCEPEFPYKAKVDTSVLDEVEFLNIEPGESIADIGSGVGDHILMLSLLYPENNFILTEVEKPLISYLKKKVKLYTPLLLNNNNRIIDVVRGKGINLNLGSRVDKIIIRNTFHHFSMKKRILSSIPNYLNDDGVVVFIEPLKGNRTSVDNCNDKMSYKEIIDFIESSPLLIIKEEIIEDVLFLRCKI